MSTNAKLCPVCDLTLQPGGLERCPQCDGVWIGEDRLTEMVQHVHGGIELAALQFDPRDATAPRICVVCRQEMAHVTFEGVPVERCTGHGVWFDGTELQQAIRAVASRPPRPGEGTSLDDIDIEYEKSSTGILAGLLGAIKKLLGKKPQEPAADPTPEP